MLLLFELGQLKKNVACRELIRQEQVMPEETLFLLVTIYLMRLLLSSAASV